MNGLISAVLMENHGSPAPDEGTEIENEISRYLANAQELGDTTTLAFWKHSIKFYPSYLK